MDHTHCRELYTRPQAGGLIIDLVLVGQRRPRWSHLVYFSPFRSTFDNYIAIQFGEGHVNVNGVSEGHDKGWETVAGLRRPKPEGPELVSPGDNGVCLHVERRVYFCKPPSSVGLSDGGRGSDVGDR